MDRIASPQDLQAELRGIMAFVHASEKPDRQVIASKLRGLADKVAVKASPEDKLRRKLVMAIYKRMPTGNKMLRSKKHTVMWTGAWAKSFKVDAYTNTVLEDMSMADLQRAAKVMGVG